MTQFPWKNKTFQGTLLNAYLKKKTINDPLTLLDTYLEKNAKVGTSSNYQITMRLLEEPLIKPPAPRAQ